MKGVTHTDSGFTTHEMLANMFGNGTFGLVI